MTRRELFRTVFAGAMSAFIPKPDWKTVPLEFKWDKTKIDFVPYKPIQENYIYGIPYHQSNDSMGSWLGITRGESIKPELTELIRKLQVDRARELYIA